MPKLSAVIIAKNEEKNIADCIGSVGFCDEVIIVDSGSSDRTVELAKGAGARVTSNGFTDYASQKNFGIQKAAGEWVFLIDADERVTPDLANEIKAVLAQPKSDGYQVVRHNRIFGRWMRHGANRNDLQTRLVKKEKAVFRGPVHERIALEGDTPRFKNPLLHYSTDNLSSYMNKLNVYTKMEAALLGRKERGVSAGKMKLKPMAIFIVRAFWQGGILDGLEGFFFSVLSAYYEFVKRAKHWELSK